MTISAKMIADSVSPRGIRICTMLLRYPRFIHAELMTHRVFSRNASSSRAIPVKRLIEDMRADPAMPVFWGGNKPGMQAGDELSDRDIMIAQERWFMAMNDAIKHAERLMEIGLHKQISNRILEPWAHINVLVTSTEWDNFWELRCHPDAQPEMQALANAMREVFDSSEPRELDRGEWHLPFVEAPDRKEIEKQLVDAWVTKTGEHASSCPIVIGEAMPDPYTLTAMLKVSVARCARTSYMTFDGKRSEVPDDLRLYNQLAGAEPIHASPLEHQAIPDFHCANAAVWVVPGLHGNFVGWAQHRKMIEAGHDPVEFSRRHV